MGGQCATNHLGPFALTEAPIPHLPDGANVVFKHSAWEVSLGPSHLAKAAVARAGEQPGIGPAPIRPRVANGLGAGIGTDVKEGRSGRVGLEEDRALDPCRHAGETSHVGQEPLRIEVGAETVDVDAVLAQRIDAEAQGVGHVHVVGG